MTRVTVVLPVYNAEKYLQAAIDSVLCQTFQDWQLVVINDGSTDGTTGILDRIVDPRVQVLHQSNGGEAAARNTGLDHALGEFVAFLDADDLYLPNALEDLVRFLDTHNEYGVVFSNGFVCDKDGNRLMRLTDHRPAIVTGDVLEPIILDPAILTVPVCTLTRRQAIESHSIRFDRSLVIGTDWDFWIQLARYFHFGYLDQETCMYRIHDTNISSLAGMSRRRQDMVHQRYKVLHSDWFDHLSAGTRSRFLYTLVMHYMKDHLEEQQDILNSPQLARLPARQQAWIWRQAGVALLQRKPDGSKALPFFQEAVRRHPGDTKAQALLHLTRISPSVTYAGMGVWVKLSGLVSRLRRIGKKRSMPMPHQLQSAGNH